MKRQTHSDKALETFRAMNTKPEDWGLTPIKWVKKTIPMPTKVRCKTCYGSGQARFKPDGETLWVHEKDSNEDWMGYQEEAREMWRKGIRKQCPTCPPRRNGSYGTGEVTVMKEREVLVGYPQWAKGTKFDSRFEHRDCQLCAKTLRSRMARVVPVNGKGSDGVIHGMWVGEDCARKFLGIKAFSKDQVIVRGK